MQNMRQGSKNYNTTTVGKAIFKPTAWLTKVDFINHLVLFNQAIVAALAEQGGGKTSFIELLQSGLDNQIKSYVIKANPSFSPTAFLQELTHTCRLETSVEQSIPNIIQQINKRKVRTLIIIDDAQHIADAFLSEMLQELGLQGKQPFLHLCLLSDFTIVPCLNELKTTSVWQLIQRFELGALSENETKRYVLSHLPKSRAQAMSDKPWLQFHHLTEGNMARINQEMIPFFSLDNLVGTVKSQPNAIKHLGTAILSAVTVLTSIYVLQSQSALDKKPTQDAQRVVTQTLRSLFPPPPEKQKGAFFAHVLPDVNLQRGTSYIPAYYAAAVMQPLQPPPLRRIVDIALDEGENNSFVVMDKVVVIPKPAHRVASKVKQGAKVERKVISRREHPKLALRQRPAASSLAILAKNKAVQQGAGYTIQLLASQNLQYIKHFAQHHHLIGNVIIRSTNKDGQRWFVLTLGDYGRRDHAQRAVNHLPAALTYLKPWIRSTAGLNALG